MNTSLFESNIDLERLADADDLDVSNIEES